MTHLQSLAGRTPSTRTGTEFRRPWVRAAAVAAAVIIAGHGLAYLIGVALLWKLGHPGTLHYADAVPAAGSTAGYLAGALWLAATVLSWPRLCCSPPGGPHGGSLRWPR